MQREERVGRGRAEARAAMFIEADLSWVGGAPAAGASCGSRLEWRVLRGGEMQTVWIDREQLHRSTRTLDTLRNRFPKALPKLVGDVEQWVAQREQLLSILKASLHDGAKLPRDLFAAPSAYPARVHAEARRLRAAHPKLGTALDDLSWYCAADDRRARRLIRWMEEDAAVFEALHEGLPPDMRRSAFASLVALYEGDGPRRIRPLMEGLADPRLYRLPMWTGGEARHLVTRLMRAWSVEPPAWQEGPPHGLVGFLTRLSGMQTAGRRRVLRIVGITWPTEQLEAWARWRERWCSLVADMRTAGRLAPKAPPIADVLAALSLDSLDGRELQRRLGEWLSTAKRLGASQPKHVIWPHWPQDLLQFGDPELAALVGPLERLLPKLPGLDRDVEAPRLWYALVWPLAIRRGQSRPRSAVKEIRALSWALAQPEFEYRWWHDRQGALTEHTLKTYYLRPFADLGWTSPVAPEVWMRVFVEIARRVRGAPHERVELLELIRSHGPSELTVRLALAWHSAGLEAWVPDGIVSTAARLSRGDEHVFVDFLRTWQARQDEDEDGVADALRALVRHFEAAGALEVLVRLHSDGRFFPLSPWGDLLVVASSTSSFPRPQAMGAVEATWIRRYPEPLWSSLAELAWARDDAEPAAARLLDKDWPDPARLEAEIAAIGARLRSDPGAPAGLNKRLESLRRRLEHPKPPSPARLSNLEKKIQLATAEAHVEDWKRRVAVYAKERVQERLGAPAASWPKGNLRRRTLFALTHLPPADRRVAGRLLKARANVSSWDLRDAPQNRGFIERMQERGLDLGPWLDGNEERLVRAKNDVVLRVRLEPDPLEVFEMGAHFSTCLRPGGVNFFSVVANAADVNKRVLYARTESGQVVGRCLLALTDGGALLTFNPYCHDRSFGFDAIVADVVGQLCASMRTVSAAVGEVSPLVAARWYDDGATHVAQSFPALAEGSSFVKSLAGLAEEDFEAELQVALHPVGLNEITASLVVSVIRESGRGLLLRPIWRQLERLRLPDGEWLRLAEVAVPIGLIGRGSAAFRKLQSVLVKQYRGSDWDHFELLAHVVHEDATAGLRTLRGTRNLNVRRWSDEDCSERLYLAGCAFEHLRRRNKAIEQFERALEQKCWHITTAETCQRRLEALR